MFIVIPFELSGRSKDSSINSSDKIDSLGFKFSFDEFSFESTSNVKGKNDSKIL